MSQGQKLPLARARQIADALVADLRPGCVRIEVAGSIRRRCPEVGDIEIVAIPRFYSERVGLFEYSVTISDLNAITDQMVRRGHMKAVKHGDKFQQYELLHAGCKLDLFLCSPETWGCILAIRTGPAAFSRQLVTAKSLGGMCPASMRFKDGRLQRRAMLDVPESFIDTPEEADVFRALGVALVEPWERR